MGEEEQHLSRLVQAASRFDDLLGERLFATFAFGVLLTWIWLGLTEGYPVFMDGLVDTPSVVIMLAAFAATLVLCGFARPLPGLLAKKGFGFGAGALGCASCLVLLLACCPPDVLPSDARLALIRFLMAPVGVSAGVLVQRCAIVYACLRPASAEVGFFISVAVMFAAYFSLAACRHAGGQVVEGVLFCLFPVLAAVLLARCQGSIGNRVALRPLNDDAYARGYLWMCVSFGVFFFAVGAKCAMEPVSEFATASDTSVVGILLVSSAFLYLVVLAPKLLGAFKVLKVAYSVSVMVLAICIALAPLSIEPYVGIVYNMDIIVLVMVLWLLTTFVAYSNEAPVCRVVGIAFSAAALGMALGWLAGSLIYFNLGHERNYPTIAIACMVAVFSTFGFSSKSFPYLLRYGEAAKKRRIAQVEAAEVDFDALVIEACGLSQREGEVFRLLAGGYGADAIAKKLVISYHTARSHVRNIYRKMDVHSQNELLDYRAHFRIAYQQEHGMSQPEDNLFES